nr:SRPBCC domain-containing protein [Xylophilus sp.]
MRTPPERVFHARVDGDALVRLLPPHGFTGRVRLAFINFATSASHALGREYLELVPPHRRFEDTTLPGTMVTTVTLRAVAAGTELHAVQENIPAPISLDACVTSAWQAALVLQVQLVGEPEIRA